MAEGLAVVGIVASIVQLLDFGSRVLERLEGYHAEFEDLPEAFRHIKSELPVLLDALRKTQAAARAGLMPEESKSALLPAIEGCGAQIRLLDDIIVKLLPNSGDSGLRRSGKALQSLRYDTKVEQITRVIRGYIQTLTFHATTSLVPTTERGQNRPSSTVPFRRDPHFVDRQILAEIETMSCRSASGIALVGLGGVGKSQLAVEHSYRVRDKSPSTWVFWVHASSTTRFREDYRKIAERVKLTGWDQPDIDILLLVYTWLCDESNGSWLMIIDNADDVEVFTASVGRSGNNTDESVGKASTLLNSIPQSTNGSILITSRSRDVAFRLTGDYATIIKVSQMDQMQALDLLRNQLERKFGDVDADRKSVESDDARALVEALDYMPLAISQAAAYINQRAPRATVSKYLQNLRKGDRDRARLLQNDLGDTRRDGTASNSVITTWQISFAHIHREKPSATQLLSLMSLFNPQGIPEYLLEGRYHDVDDVDADFEDDLNTLLSFSLIATDTDGQHFQMHRLVQYTTTTWLDLNGDLVHWKETYIILMSEKFPESNPENWNSCQDLFSHVQTAIAYQPMSGNAILAKASLLTKAMAYAYDMGYYPMAQEMGRNALDIREARLGVEHPDTLCTISRLATALRLGGQYGEAEDMFRQALRGREKVLSYNDPLTLSDLNDLGIVLSERGNFEEAEACHRGALQAQEKVLGFEHESTLQSLGDLGCVLTRRGKYQEAELLHRKALEIEMRIFGPAHKTSLASMDNLGLALGKQNNFDEAEIMHRRALEASETAFGETHPDTLICARNLASVLAFREKYKEAESLHRRVLDDSVKVLGEEHPFALYSFCNLGSALHAQAKYEEAEAMHRKALAKRTKALGPEHPHTLSSMHNLAKPLKSLGSDKEAISLMEECYRMRKRVLGAAHPDTVKSFETLKEWTDGSFEDVAVEDDAAKRIVPLDDTKTSGLSLGTAQIVILLLLGGLGSLLLSLMGFGA